MQYRIKAYSPSKGVLALNCAAGSLDEARASIAGQGLEIISIEQARLTWPQLRKKSNFNLLLFSQELQSLISAGLSLIEAITALAKKEVAGRKKTILEAIARLIREGQPFSETLTQFPAEFPDLYLALIAASERTGGVVSALGRFIAYRIRLDEVKKRVVAATLYPALLLGTGGLVVLFLMFYVVPRFTRIYEDFGRNLPFMSQMLLRWGTLVSEYGLFLLAGFVLLIIAAITYMRRRQSNLLREIIRLPALRKKVHHYELARFYRTTGVLQQGGIPLATALEMAAQLLSEETQPAFAGALHEIRSGRSLSEAMDKYRLAPPVALDLLRVGEKTGDLGEKMIRIADFYDDEQARWLEWFVRLFEPLLMLAIGMIIALVIVLLYMPIFELAETLQ